MWSDPVSKSNLTIWAWYQTPKLPLTFDIKSGITFNLWTSRGQSETLTGRMPSSTCCVVLKWKPRHSYANALQTFWLAFNFALCFLTPWISESILHMKVILDIKYRFWQTVPIFPEWHTARGNFLLRADVFCYQCYFSIIKQYCFLSNRFSFSVSKNPVR